jgi:hypothetical protein
MKCEIPTTDLGLFGFTIGLVIVFVVLIILISCTTINSNTKIPEIIQPEYEVVYFAPVEGGSFLDHKNEKALLRNEAKKDGYIRMLEDAIRIYNNEEIKK